jgi:hypothetical protein
VGQRDFVFFPEVYQFTPGSNRWTEVPSGGSAVEPPRRKRARLTLGGREAVTVERDFYLLAGQGGLGELLADLWKFRIVEVSLATSAAGSADPPAVAGTWEEKSPIPAQPRAGHSAVVIQDKMYVFGGEAGPGSLLNELWEYDLAQDSWAPIVIVDQDLPPPRASHAVAQSGNRFWIFGGTGADGVELADTWEFNATTRAWTRRADLPIPLTEAAAAALPSSDGAGVSVLVFGGKSGGAAINRTFRYRPIPEATAAR